MLTMLAFFIIPINMKAKVLLWLETGVAVPRNIFPEFNRPETWRTRRTWAAF